jgi:hypothetical protein
MVLGAFTLGTYHQRFFETLDLVVEFVLQFIGLAYQGKKDIVLRFIIEL